MTEAKWRGPRFLQAEDGLPLEEKLVLERFANFGREICANLTQVLPDLLRRGTAEARRPLT